MDGDTLAGGLYGVHRGGLFAAESMFHRVTDASKVALVAAVRSFARAGIEVFDVQMTTSHLASLGAAEWKRSRFVRRVKEVAEGRGAPRGSRSSPERRGPGDVSVRPADPAGLSTLAVPSTAASPPTVADRVLEVLAPGPLTAHQIVEAVSAASPDAFHAREGLVFPLLLDLRRRGLLRVEWADTAGGRRLFHALADSNAAATPRIPVPPAGPASPRLEEAAERATKSLSFAPRLREEFRNEILGHLRDEVASRLAAGESRDGCEKEAVRALGDPWKIGTDLARTAEGRRTVVFPASTVDSLTGMAIYDLRVLCVIVAVIVFVRVQVVTAYHIPTKSMEPTLHGDPRHGDRILVNKLSGAPERFDITVFDGFGTDRKNFVKRCVALPGEKLDLHEGDIWIDGHLVRKEGATFEALLFEVFDRARERPASPGSPARTRVPRSSRRSARACRNCGSSRATASAGCKRTRRRRSPASVSRRPRGRSPRRRRRSRGTRSSRTPTSTPRRATAARATSVVADLRLTVSVKPVPETKAKILLRLTRGEEHTYDAVVRGDGQGVRLLADGEEVARADDVSLPEGVPRPSHFSQVDRVLRLAVGGRLVLRHDLPAPEFPKRYGPRRGDGARDPRRRVDRTRAPRARRLLRARRPRRELRPSRPGPVLHDGRQLLEQLRQPHPRPGPPRRLVGSPLLVVWPPSRIHVPK